MEGAHRGTDNGGESGSGTADARERPSAYAALVRAPNLFTAPPDVLVGAALATVGAAGTGAPPAAPVVGVAGASLASMLLYGAGTTLNDYADREVDAAERPERPIPSGAVPPRAALALGGGLLCAGVAVAFVAAGPAAALVAAALAGAVALYDFPLKGTTAGFTAMGAARGLNVLLGAAAVGLGGLPAAGWAVPALVAGYIAVVTRMAADEAVGGDARWVLAVWAATAVLAAAVPAVGAALGAPAVELGAGAALAAGFLALTGRKLAPAYRSPAPATVGPAVGACILGQVVIDAAFAALVGPEWAAAVVGFLLAATALSRAFDVT